MLKVDKGTLQISEQTIREIVSAIEKAKVETTFVTTPMPDGDMSMDQFHKCKRERGEILVTSPYAGIDFSITLNECNQNQESLGYKLK